ncbi:hypothetical protein F4813DRAFT_192632 [Daldinia decipiens]|uniref:uncharacterized protein n=1 Tax=Daldinia decipiens TaxID=326647 RepID=UPI0020C2EA3A|nr:uncharacterized protein F4813DRAFT_192632 [Daldinia decipiens]KAI1654955.1 hypothetical protein F4813DRAFT_192632 [Daldinia decipiens]
MSPVIPGRSRSKNIQAADALNIRKSKEDDKNYTPSSKPRNPTVSDTNESDEEELEAEKPRRTPRSVPRPDYAELVANKDPWNLSDGDSDKVIPRSMKESRTPGNSAIKSTRSGSSISPSSSKRSTPGPSILRAKTSEPSKPFGYTSEQWPRRSAPS